MNVLMTHVCQYTGPGSVPVLLREHGRLFCHDLSFADPAKAHAFALANPGAVALAGQTPEALVAELQAAGVGIDTVIHNDAHPNHPMPVEQIPAAIWQASFEALLIFPLRLSQLFLPTMQAAKSGRFVFVTSARYLQPEPGFAVATSIRAATTAFAQALAREAAPHGIQVNVVAPNYLYSEAYYPRAKFIDDPVGREQIAAKVPFGRLGEPQEIGELIAFLASGRSSFLTGQVIDFTGGWP